MPAPPAVRAHLVPALQAALRKHTLDAEPEPGNRAVMELLHSTGLSWTDLLRVPGEDPAPAVAVLEAGDALLADLSPATCGNAVLRYAAWACPIMLASAVVMADSSPRTRAHAVRCLQDMVLDLMQFRDDDVKGTVR